MNPAVVLDAGGLDRLRLAMHGLVDDRRRAGIVYGISYRGKLAALDAYGYRDVAQQLPMTPTTICRIFSMTRAITTAAILTLLDEGSIDLDAPVADYLPEFGAMQVIDRVENDTITTVPQASKMTLRHLFTYTAGLGYPFNWPQSLNFAMNDIFQPGRPTRAGIRHLATLPLLSQPGAQWQYGLSSDVLGAIAEIVANQRLDRFLSHRLFNRLGMTDTGFWLDHEQFSRLARAYGEDLADVNAMWQPEYGTFDEPIAFLSAGGGLASTVPDYLRFCQMLLGEGELDGIRILQSATVRAMLSRQTTDEQGLTFWYDSTASSGFKDRGWGWGIGVPAGPAEPQMAGWGGLMNTFFFIDREHDLAAVAMSQYLGPDDAVLAETLQDGVYAALSAE